jgi:hypothetical protein
MRTSLELSDDPENALKQGEKLFDLRLVLGMLSSEQIRAIIAEAERKGLPDIVRALRNYLSQRGLGRPRRDTYAEIDAWLIVWANELYRSGKAGSAWSAIRHVVQGAWTAWDDGTSRGRLVQEIMVGNAIFRAPEGKLLSRQQVLGQSINAVEHRVLNRLRPTKRFPSSLRRDGHTLRFRLPDIYAHLPIYRALKQRKISAHKSSPLNAK